MSWHAQIREKMRAFLHPESSRGTRKLQVFWLGCGGFVILIVAYGMGTFLFESASLPQQEEEVKVTATSIETAPKKIDLETAFRNGIENELKALSDKITAIETLFQEGVKRGEPSSQE